MRQTRKLMVLLLVAVCLVTSIPAAYATDLFISGTKDTEKETSIDAKTEEKQENTQAGETEQEEKGEEKSEAVKDEKQQETVKNSAAGDTNSGKNPEGVFGSPEEESFDILSVEPKVEEPSEFDRYAYDPQENEPMLFDIDTWNDLHADIAKRSEWVDQTNGDGKVTLYYSSNSGAYTGTEDMNVVLIQDKSGSMDPNYGFNLAVAKNGYNVGVAKHWWYPSRNDQGWSENAADCTGEDYRNELNANILGDGEIFYNSPCQDADNRYFYMLVQDDPNSPTLHAGQMVHGNNLYNLSSTDLHCYYRLEGEQYKEYLAAGRRVLRATEWVNDQGKINTNKTYFLDVSQVYEFGGTQLLRTCDDYGESIGASRLAKSQWFMDKLVDDIQRLNPNNQIAYVPFWGDVPTNGSWQNLSSNGSETNIYPDTYPGNINYKEGVTHLGFTGDFHAVKQQINNPFTYNGTNWSRAFQKTIDLLNSRSNAEKQKKTLVLFLTDGMPQGTGGKPADLKNPFINGVNQAAELKQIPGVTIYACGVGINQQDQTARIRLDNIDSSGRANIVQYVHDFDRLYNNVINRINTEFRVTIYGNDTFYTDQLAKEFTLDEAKIGKGWKVLDSPGSGTTKGVPTAVYNAAKAGASYVYVKSTKTVYWYIGRMTNGGYSTSGHSMSFPVKYSGYHTSTGGKDSHLKTNTGQKLTYVPSSNENTLKTINLSTPSLIFHREAPSITIDKTVEGSHFTTDQTYRFAYSKNKQSGKVINKAGEATVTVKAGETKGSTTISVNPGTYYVYEVDAEDNIISSQVGTATVSINPSISTVNGNPVSVTSTEGQYENLNNYLHIVSKNANVSFTNYYVSVAVQKEWDDSDSLKRPDSITVHLLKNGKKIASQTVTEDMGWNYTFENLERYDASGKEIMYTVTEDAVKDYENKITYSTSGTVKTANIKNTLMVADLMVIKTIPADADTIWWDHGNPTFMVKISGTGLDGKDYTFYHTFVFDQEYVKANAKDGKVSMSYTFKDIPNSENYKCEELSVSRWRLDRVSGNGNNVKITKGETVSEAEMFGIYANANVKMKPEGTAVTFENVKDDYQWFNHITSVHNLIKK